MPPLYRIDAGKIVQYALDDSERDAIILKLGTKAKIHVQRFKGLGEMNPIQLRETTMDPSKRSLRRVTMKDVQAATEVFELLMGSDVGPRKEFIVEAEGLAQARIDA